MYCDYVLMCNTSRNCTFMHNAQWNLTRKASASCVFNLISNTYYHSPPLGSTSCQLQLMGNAYHYTCSSMQQIWLLFRNRQHLPLYALLSRPRILSLYRNGQHFPNALGHRIEAMEQKQDRTAEEIIFDYWAFLTTKERSTIT